jgi:hypothetical protein
VYQETRPSRPTEREQFRTLNSPALFLIDEFTISIITIDFKNFNQPSLSADYYGILILTSSVLRHSAGLKTALLDLNKCLHRARLVFSAADFGRSDIISE